MHTKAFSLLFLCSLTACVRIADDHDEKRSRLRKMQRHGNLHQCYKMQCHGDLHQCYKDSRVVQDRGPLQRLEDETKKRVRRLREFERNNNIREHHAKEASKTASQPPQDHSIRSKEHNVSLAPTPVLSSATSPTLDEGPALSVSVLSCFESGDPDYSSIRSSPSEIEPAPSLGLDGAAESSYAIRNKPRSVTAVDEPTVEQPRRKWKGKEVAR